MKPLFLFGPEGIGLIDHVDELFHSSLGNKLTSVTYIAFCFDSNPFGRSLSIKNAVGILGIG